VAPPSRGTPCRQHTVSALLSGIESNEDDVLWTDDIAGALEDEHGRSCYDALRRACGIEVGPRVQQRLDACERERDVVRRQKSAGLALAADLCDSSRAGNGEDDANTVS